MDKSINYINPALLGLNRVEPASQTTTKVNTASSEASFHQVLQREINTNRDVHFSAHARQRIASREIDLNAADVARIEQAVDQAAAKGANNTLVLSDEYALVVNVPNRTVVTAFNRQQMSQHVVTNIDSTVMID